MKGVDRVDQYLSYYSFVRKTVKLSKKVVLFLLNCALFNSFLIYKTLNKGLKEQKYKTFLHEVARNWITERGDMADSNSDDNNAVPSEKRPTPRGPAEDPTGRLLGNFSKHKLGKIVGGGQGKKKYPVRQCRVCSAHKKRSETRYIWEHCVVPFHKGSRFEKSYTEMLLGYLCDENAK
jgi:hypothetical protein